MHILYEKSFYKDIATIKDKSLQSRLIKLIQSIKEISSLSEIRSIKKMSGYDDYFRIRISDYRLGIKYKDGTITFIRFLHRKEIYKFFP